VRIGIVGTGIAGLTAAWLLGRRHEIAVFEAEERIGGHTATVDVSIDGERHAVDTGFIVFNDRTYPNFIRLMQELDVASAPTQMSFSVSSDSDEIEYAGTSLDTLLAQRGNVLRPAFWRMVRDILRFNRSAAADLEHGRMDPTMRLGEYLARNGYSREFRDWYLIPMGAAIWSAGTSGMADFPLQFFVRFFRNHGLLTVSEQPQWRTIRGGSREYLAPLSRPFAGAIRTGDPVEIVTRSDEGVSVRTRSGRVERFDELVLACHSDQALALLADPSRAETSVLSAIPYRSNDVVLHTDTRLLPRRRRAWSSWNYRLRPGSGELPVLTYDMNILQRLESQHTFCVTLNDTAAVDPARVLGRYRYSHPVFTVEGIGAQQRWQEVNGVRHTWFCGAWWANGFHEDGVVSAQRVAAELGVIW